MGLVAVLPSASGTFVATDGNDSTGDGTIGSPYLTIIKARDEIRLANTVTPIQMRGGIYHVPDAITFDSRDDGLTIQAYRGEEVIIYGGDAITGLSDGGTTWTKTTSEGFALLLDGIEQPRSALPVYDAANPYAEAGWFTMDAGSTTDTIVYEVGDIDSGLTDLTHLKIYFIPGGQFWGGMVDVTAINHGTRTITINDIGNSGGSGNPGAGDRYRLSDVKPQGTAKVLQPGEWWHSGTVLTYREVDSGFDGTGLVGAETKHIFDNWAAGTPATGLTFDGLTLRGSAPYDNHTDIGARQDDGPTGGHGYRQAIVSQGASTAVQNCKFEYCGGGVGLRDSANSTVTNNEMKFLAHAAVTLTDGCNNLTIHNNLFEDSPSMYRCFQLIAENNSVTTAVSTPVSVTHNEFNRIGARCVSWGSAHATLEDFGIWTVEYNKMIDVCMEAGDVGAIYCINRALATRPASVTNIRYNWIENPYGQMTDSSGNYLRWTFNGPTVYGIYLDDGASLVNVEGNIVIGKSTSPIDTANDGCWAGTYIHGGFENTITGNILLNCMAFQFDPINSPDNAAAWTGTDTNSLTNNICSRIRAADINGLPADSGGSPDGRLMQIGLNPPHHEYYLPDDNFYYGREATLTNDIPFAKDPILGGMSITSWRASGTPHDENSIINTDPLFTDVETQDFTLQAGTVKTAFGSDLPFSDMGRV